MIIRKEQEILGHDNDFVNSKIELRLLSGLLIVAVFVTGILWIPPLFKALMGLIAIGMLFEWYEMTKSSWLYLLIGLIIIPIPIISLIAVSMQSDSSCTLLTYFVIIWSVDTFAMIGGKNLKGPKLAPRLSPNKTWSGLIVGITAAGAMAVLLSTVPSFDLSNCYFLDKSHLILSSMFLATIAQVSDLFISYFKRKFGIKDSGNLILGHGGVLDRFDSIILTAPILFGATYSL